MRNPEMDPNDSGNPVRRKKVNYRAPALEKGLDILELLIDRQYGMAQADICRALKRSRSELYRMMQVLEERGYIYRIDRHDRYALTMKLYFLGQHHAPTRSLGALVTPAMQEFTLQTVQSCYLTVFDGDTMIVIAAADAETEWKHRGSRRHARAVARQRSGRDVRGAAGRRRAVPLAARRRAGRRLAGRVGPR